MAARTSTAVVATSGVAAGALRERLRQLPAAERALYERVSATLGAAESAAAFVHGLIDAQRDVVVRRLVEHIGGLAPDVQRDVWTLLHRFDLVLARRNQSLIEERASAVAALAHAVGSGATEVPGLRDLLREHPWLLDPRWRLLGDEVRVEGGDRGMRLDYLFAVTQTSGAVEELVVVEIKRARRPNGRVHRVREDDVDTFAGYVLGIDEAYSGSTDRPAVRGLLVADGYTAAARRKRRVYEQARSPRFEFKTWDRVLEETMRLHAAWLDIAQSFE